MSGESEKKVDVQGDSEPRAVEALLGQLFDESAVTLEGGRKVEIKKVTLRSMRPIAVFLAKLFEDLQLTADNLPSVDLQDPTLILKSIAKYYDDIVGIVAGLTSLDLDEFMDMEADEVVLIIQAVVALNQDFFTKKVLPNLEGLVGAENMPALEEPV